MYNSIDEYMQSVLGMNMPNTYMPNGNNYYDARVQEPVMQEPNRLYPEIYGIVYPVVQKVCSRRNTFQITEELINEMVEEVYNVVEPREEGPDTREQAANLKNGDVKNPRAKEVRETRRPNNNLMRDLIRILILRELLQGGWQGNRPRPPMPGPGGPRTDHGMPGPRTKTTNATWIYGDVLKNIVAL